MSDPKESKAARKAADAEKKQSTREANKEEKLERGLKDTFPASDPVSATAPGHSGKPKKVDPVRERREGHERNGDLDEALEDTFPASDPVSAISSIRTGRPYRGKPD